MFQIRPVEREDHAGLVDLWERSVRATHAFLSERDIVALRPAVAAELASDVADWWIIETRESPVGFLAMCGNSIEGLFIDPECRGRGAGTALVAFAERLATGTLTVDVNEQNPAAVGFYRSQGFRVTSRSATDEAGRPFPILHMTRAFRIGLGAFTRGNRVDASHGSRKRHGVNS